MKYSLWFFGVAAIYLAPHLHVAVSIALAAPLIGLGFYALSKGN